MTNRVEDFLAEMIGIDIVALRQLLYKANKWGITGERILQTKCEGYTLEACFNALSYLRKEQLKAYTAEAISKINTDLQCKEVLSTLTQLEKILNNNHCWKTLEPILDVTYDDLSSDDLINTLKTQNNKFF